MNQRSPASHNISSSPPLVLLVEDHDDTRELLRFVVEGQGCRVLEASDGEEAVRVAITSSPDVILMDTNLPRVDGLMATQRIRKVESLNEVPIIFISGHAGPEDEARALATGANAYFVKPIKLSELELALEVELAKRSSNASPIDQ
jgi:two-component system phosphate regulon response regulator PhoB